MRSTRRYNVALAIAFGLVSTAGIGLVAGAGLKIGAIYPLTATAVFVVLMAAVMRVAGEQHPYPRFGPANYVTTIRAIMVALVAGLIGHPATPEALWSVIGLTGVMGALDGLDGWLARRTRMASAFGARFDMETDALLILALSILVWQHGKAGAWVLLCGLMRYGFVAAGWLLPWLARPLRSSLARQGGGRRSTGRAGRGPRACRSGAAERHRGRRCTGRARVVVRHRRHVAVAPAPDV